MPLGLLQPPIAAMQWRTTLPTTRMATPTTASHDVSNRSPQKHATSLPRRTTLLASLASVMALPLPARASALGPSVDRAWEAMGGGPSDLVFPERFAGVWDVESTLVSVETPLGLEFVPDSRVCITSEQPQHDSHTAQVVTRASREDLQRPIRYRMRFARNTEDAIVPDRQFNTASLMSYYMGGPVEQYSQRITWAIEDPNVLQLDLPGALTVDR